MSAKQPAGVGKEAIPATSPALALERSLTDPETRGEWTIVKEGPNLQSYAWSGISTKYRNEARDITITSMWSGYGGSQLYTPFTLTDEEKAIVSAALCAWNAKNEAIKESEALARLISPVTASAAGAGTAETRNVAQGEARQSGAQSADAQSSSPITPNGA